MKGILSTLKGRTQHRVVSDWVLMQAYFDNDNTLMLCFADRHSNDQAVFNLEGEDIQRLSKILPSASRITEKQQQNDLLTLQIEQAQKELETIKDTPISEFKMD